MNFGKKKKKENNPKFLAIRNWLNQLWYIHVVLYPVAIINNGEKKIYNEMYNGLAFLMARITHFLLLLPYVHLLNFL